MISDSDLLNISLPAVHGYVDARRYDCCDASQHEFEGAEATEYVTGYRQGMEINLITEKGIAPVAICSRFNLAVDIEESRKWNF